jgi:hypothetical protein
MYSNNFDHFIICSKEASSTELYCRVTDKYDFEKIYSEAEIEEWKFSAKIEDHGNKAFVSRCSYTTSQGKVTCDRYEVDRIEYDENVNIKKYYIFSHNITFKFFMKIFCLSKIMVVVVFLMGIV